MHPRAALLTVLIAATSACGAGPAPDTTAEPTPFVASTPSTPKGFTAVECPAVVGGKPATLRLAVPDGFTSESTGPTEQTPSGQCTWRDPEDRFLSVQVGETESLADHEDELKQYEGIGGDDEVRNVTYDAPVDVFGDLEGERLTWWTYSDGSPAECVDVQANGISLFWESPEDVDQRLDDLDLLLDSVELIRS
ncbi:hypothetical protein ACIRON_12820 [Nocardioides sp. NPDC101246]|uniref:hypothetical protein n=1 Tax=Nocardioides sp. NPDC101246 TaxID=3364336 RepID=UPI00380C2CE2